MDLSYTYMAGGITPLPGIRFQCRTTPRSPEVCLEVFTGSKWPYKGITQIETKGYSTVSPFWFFHCLIGQGRAFNHMLQHLTKFKVFWRQSGKREQTSRMLSIQSTQVLPEKLWCKSDTFWFSVSAVYKSITASRVLALQWGTAKCLLLTSLSWELPGTGLDVALCLAPSPKAPPDSTWLLPPAAQRARLPLQCLIKRFKLSTFTLGDSQNLNPPLNFSVKLLQYFHCLSLLQIVIYL